MSPFKRSPISLFVVGILTVVVVACGRTVSVDPAISDRLPETVDYNFHVKPILSDRCYACHGPDGQALKAGLRLDIESGALRTKLESGGRAIVPGNSSRSKVVRRIFSDDPEFVMPPPESHLNLTDYEKAVIVKWIEQGAEWKPHWAFLPVSSTAPTGPIDQDFQDWPSSDIDRFVLNQMLRAGLQPNDEASRERLIRRVSFDLTGLPPTIDEIDAFLADKSEGAYEKVVDRLLHAPSYGEHMAAEWLDIARYADSHGYQDDGLRNMWPWRDWVIKSFNENMPYDQFITVQLAGDLLPDRTRDDLLATGFNRNHLQSQEGGIVPEEYRVDYVADRTNTLGRSMLGLGLECSRCHDHKFDPITQKEYFEFFAFFNSVQEFGNIPYAGEASPTIILKSDEAADSLEHIDAQIAELEALVDFSNVRYDEPFQSWQSSVPDGDDGGGAVVPVGRIAHYPLDAVTEREFANDDDPSNPATLRGDADKVTRTVAGKVGAAQKLVGDPFIDMGKEIGYFERNQPFSIGLWFNIEDEDVEGPLFNKAGGLFNGMRGYVAMINDDLTLSLSLNHVFPANSIEIQTVAPLATDVFQHLTMTYDGSSRVSGLKLYLDGAEAETRVNADNLKMSILYQVDPRTRKKSNWGDPGNLRIGWMEPNTAKLDSVVVDEFVVFDRELTAGEVSLLSGESRTLSQKELRAFYVSTVDPDYQRDFAALTELRGQQNEIMTRQPEVMVLEDLPEPRQTFLLNRGSYDAPTDPVDPDTPDWLLEYDESLERNRLGLAKWLTDPEHPLTARVAVNRLWQRFFGLGIVSTPDDFGNQGARPSHPELLDWLAAEFVRSGWDVKAMQKQIVLSATYRQSSLAGSEKRRLDPDNVFLSRGPSRRLAAEMIRDHALAASGLLVRKIGGPSVKPYQPEGLWKELATRNATVYVQDHGEKLYRRSLYTIWKRTTPPPSMVSFDAANRDICTVRRQSTSTPLQALVLMNDPQYVETSRALAELVIRERASVAEQLSMAFRLLATRTPTDEELELLSHLYSEQRSDYLANRASARSLLAVGEAQSDSKLDVASSAAMTVVVSTIMSFDDAVMLR